SHSISDLSFAVLVEVPAHVDPLAVAIDEHFGRAAGVFLALALLLDFIQIIRVEHSDASIDLNLSFGKLQACELAAGVGESFCARQYLLAPLPFLLSGIDSYGLRRDRFFEMRAVVGEEVAPHRIASGQQLLLPLRSELRELFLEVLLRVR